jgi:hypothetical protein
MQLGAMSELQALSAAAVEVSAAGVYSAFALYTVLQQCPGTKSGHTIQCVFRW